MSPNHAARALFCCACVSNAFLARCGDLQPTSSPPDTTFQQQVQKAISGGINWLLTHQQPEGWWSSEDVPALTALAVTAIQGQPDPEARSRHTHALRKAYDYILSCRHEEGGIHRGTLQNYNTAISAVALSLAENPAYDEVLRAARRFLIRSQIDLGEAGKVDTPFDGGVGYGSHYDHSDLANTLFALEAVRATDRLEADTGNSPRPQLNWAAAVQFLQNCQNLPAVNAQPWVSDRPEDRGGFVYYPGESKAGGVTNAITGKVALRSYGSISYAGLMSYLYARLDRQDPRVEAVLKWLQDNYTVQENPGMGQQGFYFYLQLMTKALTAAHCDAVQLRTGDRADWRREVAMRLMELQSDDGSWSNPNNRWWEKDPNLATAYAVITLDMLWPQL